MKAMGKSPVRTRHLPLFAVLILAGVFLACAQVRYAQTEVGQTIDNPVTQTYPWGEVYCGQGTVCAEIEVRRVDVEDEDGGRVQVTLHNRTGEQVAAQIQLQILDGTGAELDSTNFENVPLQPRQEMTYEMPGVYRKGAKVRVVLRAKT
jgi:hypothetical protein